MAQKKERENMNEAIFSYFRRALSLLVSKSHNYTAYMDYDYYFKSHHMAIYC